MPIVQTNPAAATSAEPEPTRLSRSDQPSGRGRVDLVHPRSTSLQESMAAVCVAREAGFERLWISEVAGFDAFVLAGRMTALTTDLPLVIGPLPAPLRTAPQLAMAAASLSGFGANVAVVLGSSSPAIVRGWHGRRPTRIAQLQALVETFRTAIAGGRPSCDLPGAQSHGFRLALPAASVPIGIAALGPRTLDAAARVADHVVTNFVTVERGRELADRVREISVAVGRATPRITVWLHAAVGATESERQQCRQFLARYVRAPGYRENFSAQGFEEEIERLGALTDFHQVARAISDELLETVIHIGSVDQVRSKIDQLTQEGLDVAVASPLTDVSAALRTFALLGPASSETGR